MARKPTPIGLPRTGRSVQREFIGQGQAQTELEEWARSPNPAITAMVDALVDEQSTNAGTGDAAARAADQFAGVAGSMARLAERYGLGELGADSTKKDQRWGRYGPGGTGGQDSPPVGGYWDELAGWVVSAVLADDGRPSIDPMVSDGDDGEDDGLTQKEKERRAAAAAAALEKEKQRRAAKARELAAAEVRKAKRAADAKKFLDEQRRRAEKVEDKWYELLDRAAKKPASAPATAPPTEPSATPDPLPWELRVWKGGDTAEKRSQSRPVAS